MAAAAGRRAAWTVRAVRDTKLGVKNLLLHKLRSLLTMLGLVFGVGSVIAMLAIGEGASAEAIAQIRRLGSKNILLRASKPAADSASGSNNARLSVYGLLYGDARRIEETIPGVSRVVPDANSDSSSVLNTVPEDCADPFSANGPRIAVSVDPP